MLRRQQNQKREHPQMIPGFIFTQSLSCRLTEQKKQQKTRIPRMKLLKAPANFLKKRKLMKATAFLEGEAESCDFGTIETGNEGGVQAQFEQITNTGSETLNFQPIRPEHFMVADI